MHRLFGIFTNLEDARNAAGRIKKETWNRAEVTVIVPGDFPWGGAGDQKYEFGTDLSIAEFGQPTPVWPGLIPSHWEGHGLVKVGSSGPGGTLSGFTEQLNPVIGEIDAHKIVMMIDCEHDLLAKIKVILESKGAEIIDDQV